MRLTATASCTHPAARMTHVCIWGAIQETNTAAPPPSTCCAPLSVQVLDLSSNRLCALPPDVGWLQGLRQLNVSGNPDLRTPCKAVLAKGLRAVMSYLQARVWARALAPAPVLAWALSLSRDPTGSGRPPSDNKAPRQRRSLESSGAVSRPTWPASASRWWRWRRQRAST